MRRPAGRLVVVLAAVAAACASRETYRPLYGDYWHQNLPDGSKDLLVERFPTRLRFIIGDAPRRRPNFEVGLPEGTFLFRIETDRPATLKVTLDDLEFSGGFDLPTPICVHICVAEEPCGPERAAPASWWEHGIGRPFLSDTVGVTIYPIGPPPTWIDFTVERTSDNPPPGPERRTCPEKATSTGDEPAR